LRSGTQGKIRSDRSQCFSRQARQALRPKKFEFDTPSKGKTTPVPAEDSDDSDDEDDDLGAFHLRQSINTRAGAIWGR
jgi:hypothetical protein